ncbi:MAG: serine/threonine-protein kinase, partial [Candidatus Zixiibacteriota bacterium]
MIGQSIGHYKIISKLGSGGMGEVYLAEDTTLDRKVALKFLPEALSQNPEARERLLREAKAASKLNHSNIVTVHAVGRDADRDFIAMEYVDGRPLDEYLGEKKRSTDELLRIAVQMARALEHAHAAGIIHRDLKPANIFIDREDRVRILDFGLASLPGARKLTQTGSTVGTIAYMAPEQVQGREADERSDLFSFGILLYEMLAGRPPFGGDHHAAIMYSILNDTPAPLSPIRPDIHPGIEALVIRVLEKEPAHRYQSARDILADLRRLREGSGPSRVHSIVTPPPPSRRLPRFVIPAALATVALVILFVLQPWKVEVTSVQEAQARENRLAVMYFDNLSDPADPKRLGEIAANLLITSLSESEQLQVVSSQRLYDILKLLGREGEKHMDRGVATQVADRAGARWMLMGTILQSEPFLVVTSQVVELATGNAIASQRAEGVAGENIFVVADRLTNEIQDDLALSAAAPAGGPSAQAATQSEDAYRHYLEGMDNVRKLYYPEAEVSFRKA